jgi:hypothetical protein
MGQEVIGLPLQAMPVLELGNTGLTGWRLGYPITTNPLVRSISER